MNRKIVKDVCIFDLDGTLVKSMEVFADLAAALIEENYFISSEEAKKVYYQTSGLPFIQQLEVLFPNHHLNKKIADQYEDEKLRNYYSLPYFDDVPYTLKKLKELGFKIVISSNNHQEVVETYINKNFEFPFDAVLGYSSGFTKGIQHFNCIQKLLKSELKDMIFVGDSLHDAEQALKCGVDFFAKLGTFKSSDFHHISTSIQTIPDIKTILDYICKSSY